MREGLIGAISVILGVIDGLQFTDSEIQLPKSLMASAESLRLEYQNQLHSNKLDPTTIEQYPPAIEQEQLNVFSIDDQIATISKERTAAIEDLESALVEKEAEIAFAVSQEETTGEGAKGGPKTVKKFTNETLRKSEIAMRMGRSPEFQELKRSIAKLDQDFRERLRDLYLKKATSESRITRLKSELAILMLKLEFQLLGKR